MKFLVEIEVTRLSGPNRSWDVVQEALELDLPSDGLILDVEGSEFEVTEVFVIAAPQKRRVQQRAEHPS